MNFVRLPDWSARLSAVVDEVAGRPFSWEAGWVCVHWVDLAVERMTGVPDALGLYRDGFWSEQEAWAMLAAHDGSLRAACRRVFGTERVGPFARRGDVAMLRGRRSIGICLGATAAFVGEAGLERVPMAECPAAFPLGWPG